MFDIRSEEWVYHSIPAQSWKYRENRFALDKNYSNYPSRVATHSEKELFIQCSYCLTDFATDPKRRDVNGTFVYSPITNFITYRRDSGMYRCLMPCMSSTDYVEKERQDLLKAQLAFNLANRHLL